ncbi:MAG: hypothetical protein ACLFNO_01115 [Parcubacteria group bacterium]
MSRGKVWRKIDEKTAKRNINLSRRTAELAERGSSVGVSVLAPKTDSTISMISDKKEIEKSDVAKINTGFKSIGTKSESKADELKKKKNDYLGPKAHGVNPNYSNHNDFGLN